jgi:hypothetical protein
MTWDEAASLTGCPRASLYPYVQAGRIRHRDVRARRGSLERSSVERFATWFRAARTEREAARARAAAAKSARKGLSGPPDVDGVWLDLSNAALVLGFSGQYLGRLAGEERVPAVRRGRRWWFRREDVERLAAARAFESRFRPRGFHSR